MAWIALILAGFGEVFGVTMINKYHQKQKWYFLLLLITGFALSFLLLTYAMEYIAMGTAYAIWTGIGASGGAIIGMLFFNESKDWQRILFITIIIASVIGLKLTA
ncbi:multidrug efflux SMR transporter [Bacillus sp. DNRA2]|uniref:DMT family transporter n=1 Tax=Bacillus sp. DNRA2 TaxID=2723053 RepID=UPI00145F9ABA|nr:multidrug efflux SMR transporter [Bacillus sp. DNRA2]NMD71320.1 multidrug efflux SMR transporter [Bacillus sp. DNRA2]